MPDNTGVKTQCIQYTPPRAAGELADHDTPPLGRLALTAVGVFAEAVAVQVLQRPAGRCARQLDLACHFDGGSPRQRSLRRSAGERLAQVLVDLAPDWRDAVERYGFDHVERDLAVYSERIQPGQEPLQRKPDTSGPFGAMKRLDVPLVAIAFHRSAQEDDQIYYAVEAPGIRRYPERAAAGRAGARQIAR